MHLLSKYPIQTVNEALILLPSPPPPVPLPTSLVPGGVSSMFEAQVPGDSRNRVKSAGDALRTKPSLTG